MPLEHMVVHSREAECEGAETVVLIATAKFLGRCLIKKYI